MAYESVLAPLSVGGLELPNRVVRAAHLTQFTSRGRVTDRLVAYHEARARGGVGLTILEGSTVDRRTCPAPLDASGEAVVEGWARIADAVHPHGMKVFAQLYHGGNQVAPLDGSAPWSASTVPGWTLGLPAQAMTEHMVEEIVGAFARAAARAVAAGLDGVELHGAHGYLLAQFLSPLTNRRTDGYGGSPANRLRFVLEVLAAVRDAVGPGYPVAVRLSGNECLPGGLDNAACTDIARAVDSSGLVDVIDLSAGLYQSMHKMIGATYEPHGYELADSVAVARAVSVPCIVTGRITTLDEADEVVARGDAALVSMVRATIADANLVRRAVAGRAPRPCIGCLQGCFGGLFTKDLGCTVNATVGREADLDDEDVPAAPVARHVVVVGGGPAGLEAARVAALRGHRVVLYERRDDLGGQLRLARRTPGRGDMGLVVDWLAAEVRRLGVQICTGTDVTADGLAALGRPDVVVVATGPSPRADLLQLGRPALVPELGDLPVLTSWDVVDGAGPHGGPVVVLDDVGHMEGMTVCELLVDRGCGVTAVTRFPELATQVLPAFATGAGREHLARSAFSLRPRSFVAGGGAGRVTVGSLDGGPEVTVDAQALVAVTFHEPASGLADALRGGADQVHVVGEAATQRFLTAAVNDSHQLARAL